MRKKYSVCLLLCSVVHVGGPSQAEEKLTTAQSSPATSPSPSQAEEKLSTRVINELKKQHQLTSLPASVEKEIVEQMDNLEKDLPNLADEIVTRWLDDIFRARRKELLLKVLPFCGGAAFLVLVLGFIFFLRFRRHRRLPGHCWSCGYSLHGLDAPRCPECGTPFDPALLESKPGRS